MKMVGLMSFLRGSTNPKDGMPGCANFDHYYGGCLQSTDCRVEKGQRCGYFEKAVLPTARQSGQTDRIYGKYEAKVGLAQTPLPRGEAQGCPDCGAEMEFGRKYCRQCTIARRQKATQDARERRRSDDRIENVEFGRKCPNPTLFGAIDAPDAQNQ